MANLIIPFKVINKGGIAESHQLRLADVGEMYSGLHRVISYIGLSYLRGELVERANFDAELKILQERTGEGSVFHDLSIWVAENQFAGGLLVGVLGNQLTKVVDYCIRATAGMIAEEDYGKLPNGLERIEPFFDDLIEKIEPHVAATHASIHGHETVDIDFGDGPPIHLNAETKEYVSTSNTSRRKKDYTGTVTRLNLVTGNGRFFCNELQRIVSFSQPTDFRSSRESKRLSWSLRQRDQELPSKIKVSVREVTTNSGRIKRFKIQSAARVRGQ